MPFNFSLKKSWNWLASVECAVFLFLAIAVIALPGTFTESRAIYSNPLFLTLLALFALCLLLCTVKRAKSISKPVLVIHSGVLLVLAGCIGTTFGFVATVNIYEGTSTNRFYNWDIKEEIGLGFDLRIRKVNKQYYPIPVKVGVLKGEKKENLFTLKTGESFSLNNYLVLVEALDPGNDQLSLAVYEKDQKLGIFNTSGVSTLPPSFPYTFKLVAYQNPRLKRMWVDLDILRGDEKIAAGSSEVNAPFYWEGLYFYNTLLDKDPNGAQFAGMQIVNDPGRPLVFAGLAVIGLGAVLSFWRRFVGSGRLKSLSPPSF